MAGPDRRLADAEESGMMKSGRIRTYNGTPAVEYTAIPDLTRDHVLIRVHAASLNPLDVKLMSGTMQHFFPLSFPYALGTDLAGTIEHVGSPSIDLRPGDRVVARPDPTLGGAFAEYAVALVKDLAVIPDSVSFEDAAGLPTAAGTAQQALFEVAKLNPGQWILVHGGAGGVGSFAIQLARLAGARVAATASGSGVGIARRLGADRVIDHRSEDFTGLLSDMDVVLDTVGGETQQRSFEVLRAGGVLVSTISPPDQDLARAHSATASFVYHQTDSGRLAHLLSLVEAGSLKVLIDRQTSLQALAGAMTYQAAGHARGKIIVDVG